MDKQSLLHKWMNKELSPEQEQLLMQDPEMKVLMEIAEQTAQLQAPEFPKDVVMENIRVLNQPPKVRRLNPIKYVIRIAAIFAIVAVSYVFWQSLDTNIDTQIAEKTQIFLPDESSVDLNANSYLTYNTQDWRDARSLKLEGEAFFKVAKGSAFVVETQHGDVTVLGTQFNVYSRGDRLKVSCFEGVVSVSLNDQVIVLEAGMAIDTQAGKALTESRTALSQPKWLQDESSFENAPLSEVLFELEQYYDIELQLDNIDLSQRFTGSFTHQDLDIALQSICNPLQMTYRVLDQNNVVLNEAK